MIINLSEPSWGYDHPSQADITVSLAGLIQGHEWSFECINGMSKSKGITMAMASRN